MTGATLGFFIGFAAVTLFAPLIGYISLSPVEKGLLLSISSLTGSLFRIPFTITILHLKGYLVFYSILIITLMVPVSSLVLPLAILFKNFGWTNRYIGLIFPYVALGVLFTVVVLRGFLEFWLGHGSEIIKFQKLLFPRYLRYTHFYQPLIVWGYPHLSIS